jgi:hypothetical protein
MVITWSQFNYNLNSCQYNKIRLLKTSIQSMNAHRVEAALTENSKLSLQNLPFKKRYEPAAVSAAKERAPRGDEVKIIILDRSSSKNNPDSYPLRATVIRYDEPFEPAIFSEEQEST